MDAWVILFPAFCMCVLMAISHTYFGLHVLARGIIFVDLALAQIAALGLSVAFLFGEDPHSYISLMYAFTATLIASFAFAYLRHIPSKTAREVTIGCVYIVSTALSIMILSRSTQGMEELKNMLNGNILWVTWEEIFLVLCFYAFVMLLHFLRKKQFFNLSFNNKATQGTTRNTFIWEFIFFASFSIIITLAVNVAGVLLVFAMLIIPAFSATLLSANFLIRLITALTLALIASLAGLWISLSADLPVGATLVATLGLLPITAFLYSRLSTRNTIKN